MAQNHGSHNARKEADPNSYRFNEAVAQNHGSQQIADLQATRKAASMRPWHRTTDHNYQSMLASMRKTCFNEAVAQNHGSPDEKGQRVTIWNLLQ